jgi:hypothetical protein
VLAHFIGKQAVSIEPLGTLPTDIERIQRKTGGGICGTIAGENRVILGRKRVKIKQIYFLQSRMEIGYLADGVLSNKTGAAKAHEQLENSEF